MHDHDPPSLDDHLHLLGPTQIRLDLTEVTTCEWSLFEVVQRSTADATVEFDLLEGLSLFKPGQRLVSRGTSKQNWNGEQVQLDRFQQWGVGVLPFDYWVDQHHRLVLVTTLSRAYVLDADAEKTAQDRLAEMRSNRRRRNR